MLDGGRGGGLGRDPGARRNRACLRLGHGGPGAPASGIGARSTGRGPAARLGRSALGRTAPAQQERCGGAAPADHHDNCGSDYQFFHDRPSLTDRTGRKLARRASDRPQAALRRSPAP